MAFTRPTVDTIYQRIKADMEARLTGNVRIAKVSVLGILAMVFAGALHLAYGALIWFAKQLFPDTASTTYLDTQAALKNLARKAASFTTGTITVTGTDTTVIPAGTIWQDSDGNQYATDALETITGGTVQVEVTAVVEGSVSNSTATELEILSPIANVDSTAAILSGFSNGQDQETDSQLRRRILDVYKAPPAGGRATDYKRWALETLGIYRAWVKPLYLGSGTVGIVVADENGNAVSTGVKATAQAYIDTQRPLGVVARVEDIVAADVQFDISITPNTTDVQGNIDAALSTLFLEESEPGVTFPISRIRTTIGQNGVDDYSITEIRVDGTPVSLADIAATGFTYLKFDSVTYASL